MEEQKRNNNTGNVESLASRVTCPVCPHACSLSAGQVGRCGARVNKGGEIVARTYGCLSSLALDPIEKKPLRRFHPGATILSLGSFGCNLSCPFCQNAAIAQPSCVNEKNLAKAGYYSPSRLVEEALSLRSYNNIGIAYTYNEPLVNFEYVYDCARLAHSRGLLNVIVSNGYVNQDMLGELLPYIDAANIDLKAFTSSFYHMLGAELEPVLRSIQSLAEAKNCHLEVTTLIVPGENDSPEEIDAAAAWLSSLDPNIAYHISRFFPRHRMADKSPTPISAVYSLAQVARRHLRYVYTGNC